MIRDNGGKSTATETGADRRPDGDGPAETQDPAKRRLLAVGDMVPPREHSDQPDAAELTCLTFAEVTTEALARIGPEVVFSSLVGVGFDCLELAERLAAAGYRGKYRAVAPQVPDPKLVRREITERCPALDFDLIVLADRD